MNVPLSCLALLLAFAACAAPPVVEAAPPAVAAAPPADAGRLHGRVMQDGRPVVGLVIALYPPRPANVSIHQPIPIATAVAGDDGCYAFRQPVAPGEYVLELQDHRPKLLEGSQRSWLVQQPLVVTSGQVLPPLDFVLDVAPPR